MLATAGTYLAAADADDRENGIVRVKLPDSFGPRCEEGVSRQGEYQPCDKPSVAFRADPEGAYPVCAYHSRGEMVPLVDLLREAVQP